MRRWQPLPESLEPATKDLVERMRALKDATGMSLAELAARTAHSKSAWHRYLNGRQFSPHSAVEALGRLRAADLPELLELWTVSEQSLVPQQPHLPPLPAAPAPRRYPRRQLLLAAALTLSPAPLAWTTIAGSSLLAGRHAPTTVPPATQPSTAPAVPASCRGEGCEGQYPAPSGCTADALTESSVAASAYSVRLRYSPCCGAVWTEVTARASTVHEISIKMAPKDELSSPPNDRFPSSSPMFATTDPRAAEACAVVGDTLACTSPSGGGEINLIGGQLADIGAETSAPGPDAERAPYTT
ncbi:XRE family transcriptional regulator [Streptomyces sp. CoH27]|uniref:helix-turn-helix domain-containing protein n=1 Tax=Streptomyces sp. CoH27 TaxID=2875763 RepID=UPI001CD59569|nr:XRE family transcriptional regulator [Streptomyces sp. CoH27]